MKKITKQSRWIIYTSLFLSGTVIFSALLYYFSAKESSDKSIIWLFIAILAIAVMAVAVVIYTRKKMRTKARLLNEDFFTAYEAIADSMNGSVLGYMEKRETLKDILGLFIDAQASGRTAEQVTGGNISVFVSQVQDSFGYRSKFLFASLSGIEYAIIYMFMIQIYEWLRGSEGLGFFHSKPGYSSIILLLPIALIGIPLLNHYVRKQKMFIGVGIILGFFAIGVAFMEFTYANYMGIEWIRKIHEETFSYVPGWGFLVLWISIFAVSLGLKWIIRRKSIEKL